LKNIPRTDLEYKMSDPQFMNFSLTNFHCKKMLNSLKMVVDLKVNGEMNNPERNDVRKINKIKQPNIYIDKLCELQNQKFGKIVNFQKDDKILREKSLPKIRNEIKEIIVDNNYYNNGNSKFMGGRYNPFNYDLFTSKNRIKRNVFGTLFIN
jgi:hypothetical protein